MKSRRFCRIASRPCQSATPRLHTASSAKQSNPAPNVLSSIVLPHGQQPLGGRGFGKDGRAHALFLACIAACVRQIRSSVKDLSSRPGHTWRECQYALGSRQSVQTAMPSRAATLRAVASRRAVTPATSCRGLRQHGRRGPSQVCRCRTVVPARRRCAVGWPARQPRPVSVAASCSAPSMPEVTPAAKIQLPSITTRWLTGNGAEQGQQVE